MGYLYAVLGLACIGLALYLPAGAINKLTWTAATLAVFSIFPISVYFKQQELAAEKQKRDASAAEAWAYFKRLCKEKAGEKIYRTVLEEKSVFVVQALPPATERDLHNQYWYGDPYSNATPWAKRGETAARRLASDSRRPSGLQRGLDFVEMQIQSEGAPQFVRIERPSSPDQIGAIRKIDKPVSRFGVAWEDISTEEDRKHWVAGSRLRVIDRGDNSIVAERIGYLIEPGFGSKSGQRVPWLSARSPGTTCPPISGGDYTDQWFVTTVLQPKD